MLEQTRKFYIMERTDNNGALTFYLNEVGESKNPGSVGKCRGNL